MADEEIVQEEELLKKEMADLDEKMRKLAYRIEEIAEIDCDFGECIFDPEMESVEEKIEEVQRRKKLLEGVLDHLEAYNK